jgi:hypothetical protein
MLIDETGVLSEDEFKRLKSFIVDHCYCSTEETAWLQAVKVRNDGPTGYRGYWTAGFERENAEIKNLKAVIILNAYYLLTVEQMEGMLAHEFGPHWTLETLMTRYETPFWFGNRTPYLYTGSGI